MALTLGANTSDRVDFGNPGNIIVSDIVVFGLWCRPTTLTSGRALASKNFGDALGGPFLRLNGTGGDLQLAYAKGIANAVATSNSTPLVNTSVWYCVFGINNPADTQPRIYTGTRAAPLTEVTYAGGATQGSGTSLSTANVRAGTLGGGAGGSTPVLAFQGDIADFLYLVGRVPTLGEMIEWQYHPRNIPNSLVYSTLGYNNVSTQPDWSGHGNVGTITGATLASVGPPIGPHFGRDVRASQTPSVTATGNPWYYYLNEKLSAA